VLVQVTIDGQQVVSQAVGESMTGVPATTDMHFRNGAVAESYMSTLLLMLVDEKKVSLDDNVAKWLPDLPHADDVTLGQFVQMTCGYVDYEQLPEFTAANYAEPFKLWTPKELLSYAVGKPLWYTPGTNLNYAHTNYVILGLALEKITGQDLNTALREKVLGPLGLHDTTDPAGTAAINSGQLLSPSRMHSSRRRISEERPHRYPAADPVASSRASAIPTGSVW